MGDSEERDRSIHPEPGLPGGQPAHVVRLMEQTASGPLPCSSGLLQSPQEEAR